MQTLTRHQGTWGLRMICHQRGTQKPLAGVGTSLEPLRLAAAFPHPRCVAPLHSDHRALVELLHFLSMC